MRAYVFICILLWSMVQQTHIPRATSWISDSSKITYLMTLMSLSILSSWLFIKTIIKMLLLIFLLQGNLVVHNIYVFIWGHFLIILWRLLTYVTVYLKKIFYYLFVLSEPVMLDGFLRTWSILRICFDHPTN